MKAKYFDQTNVGADANCCGRPVPKPPCTVN